MRKILLLLLLSLTLITLVSAAEWDNVILEKEITKDTILKIGEKDVIYNKLWETYKPIVIENQFTLGKVLAEGAIISHTSACSSDCLSEFVITTYEESALIQDIKFYKINKETKTEGIIKGYKLKYYGDVKEYSIVCVNSGLANLKNNSYIPQKCSEVESGVSKGWIEYKVGDILPAGDYKIQLSGIKNPSESIDWVIKTQGKTLDSWAVWGNITTGDTAQVTLTAPADTSTQYSSLVALNATFNISAASTNLKNVTLYDNSSGTWDAKNSSTYFLGGLDQSFGTGADDYFTLNNNAYLRGQSFTAGANGALVTVSFKVFRAGLPKSNSVRLYLANQSTYYPIGSAVATSEVKDLSTITTSSTGEWVNWTFSTPYTLVNGTIYAVVIGGTYNTTDKLFLIQDRSSPSYTRGYSEYSDDGGTNWGTLGHSGNWDSYFETYIGGEAINTTKSFTNTYSVGQTVKWNYYACDSSNSCGFAPSNYTFIIDSTPPTISISSPSSLVDYLYENYNQTLTFTATDTNLDDCWYDYNGTNKTIACSTGVAKTDYYNQSIGKYDIRVWANDTAGNKASTLLSYSAKVIENSRTSDASTFDTATANYGVNVTANSSLTGINLFYNGTNYALTNQGSGIWNISRQLPTSSVGTQSFQYKFQYGTETITSYNSTQTVTATVLAECDGTYTIPFLNLTFKDENTLTAINATIPTSSFVYYLGNGTVNKTLSYSNNSLNYNYSFCGTSGALPLIVYPVIQYKQGTAYPQRIWTPSAQSYSSSLTNQTLYLLSSSDGLYVTFQVIDNSDATISGVDVNVSRIVDGSTVLVSSGTTDSGGLVTFWLNPDFQHTLTFTKSGYTTYTTSLFPTQSSYTVTLGAGSVAPPGELTGVSYGMIPTDNFLDYYSIQNFSFVISSDYFSLDEFGYDLNWSNGTLIDTQSSVDSSGGTLNSLNINVSNASSIIMSPYYIIDGVTSSINPRYWYLQSSEGREFSIYQWFGDFTTYTSTGTSVLGFNDFGKLLLTALVLVLIVGGLSQRYGLQSEAAITGILFSVIFFLEYSLEWIPQIATPLGTLPKGTLTIISGIILLATIIAGERR